MAQKEVRNHRRTKQGMGDAAMVTPTEQLRRCRSASCGRSWTFRAPPRFTPLLVRCLDSKARGTRCDSPTQHAGSSIDLEPLGYGFKARLRLSRNVQILCVLRCRGLL